jgi:hypothetical protein
MQNPEYEAEKHRFHELLEARYRKVREIVAARGDSVLHPLPFNSGYFMSFSLQDGNAEQVRCRLLQDRGIGTISIQEKLLRVAYSSVELDQIQRLYDEIYRAAESDR